VGVSDDDMPGTASGWWHAACSIVKARDEVCCPLLPCFIFCIT